MPVFQGDGTGEFIWGSAQNDTVYGRGGSDNIYGNGGNDWISAGRGHDFVSGGSGNDTLLGRRGDDTIVGGDGNDIIDGGEGQDQMFGGAGVDVFYFTEGESQINTNDPDAMVDTIMDFEVGVDTIVINATAVNGFGWDIQDYTADGYVIIANYVDPGASDDFIVVQGITDFQDFEANANILFV